MPYTIYPTHTIYSSQDNQINPFPRPTVLFNFDTLLSSPSQPCLAPTPVALSVSPFLRKCILTRDADLDPIPWTSEQTHDPSVHTSILYTYILQSLEQHRPTPSLKTKLIEHRIFSQNHLNSFVALDCLSSFMSTSLKHNLTTPLFSLLADECCKTSSSHVCSRRRIRAFVSSEKGKILYPEPACFLSQRLALSPAYASTCCARIGPCFVIDR